MIGTVMPAPADEGLNLDGKGSVCFLFLPYSRQ